MGGGCLFIHYLHQATPPFLVLILVSFLSSCMLILSFFLLFLFHPSHLSSTPSAPYGATACVTTPLGPLCSAACIQLYSSITGLCCTKAMAVSCCVFTSNKLGRCKDPGSKGSKMETAAFRIQSRGVCTGINQCQHAIFSQSRRG